MALYIALNTCHYAIEAQSNLWAFLCKLNLRALFAGLEWCVEAEASPPIVSDALLVETWFGCEKDIRTFSWHSVFSNTSWHQYALEAWSNDWRFLFKPTQDSLFLGLYFVELSRSRHINYWACRCHLFLWFRGIAVTTVSAEVNRQRFDRCIIHRIN